MPNFRCATKLYKVEIYHNFCAFLLSRLLMRLLANSTLETIPKNNLIVRGSTEAESKNFAYKSPR